MSEHFNKFVFLGVMIVIALIAHHNTAPVREPLRLTYGAYDAGADMAQKTAPLFVLQPPEQVVAEKIAAASQNQFVKAAENSLSMKKTSEGGDRGPDENISVQTVTQPSGTFSDATFLESESSPVQPAFSRTSNATPPPIQAAIALVADVKSGEQYMNLGAGNHWPLASVTKLMTAVIALKYMDINARIAVSPASFSVDPTDQTLKAGDEYALSDFLRIMLLPSSNVAAEAIAGVYSAPDGTAGGRGGFIALMNAQAKEWGMAATMYADPSGLSSSDQTTAGDMLLLARRIYAEYPQILAITRTPSVYATELRSGKRVLVGSINNFAGRADFLGGKTGYTDEASGNLFSVFSYHKRPLFVLVLGTNDRFGDTEKLLNWFEANYK